MRFDWDSFMKLIDTINGSLTTYYSVYSCDKDKCFDNTVINVLFFDFDYGEDSLGDVKKFSNYLSENNWKHMLIFSGNKGFHIYVLTKEYKPGHVKDTLANAFDYFVDKLNLMADPHIRGNVKQLARMPNTWHIRGKRYCIPLIKADLEKGIEHIKKKAKEQQSIKFYGNGLFDLKPFDYSISNRNGVDIPEYNYNCEVNDRTLQRFLPCIQRWLLNENEAGTWKARYFFSVYCKERLIPRDLCTRIAKKYFGAVLRKDRLKDNYDHFRKFSVLNLGYREDTIFPNCSSLYTQKLCPGRCKYFKEKGSPCYK